VNAVQSDATTKPWGIEDEELASRPLAFREDLFAGQTMLVSGGGSGFGRAIA
jgi:citronellol/citronellal dehydrogenase